MEKLETKTVWVAWTNSDLTEGRGYRFPLVVCESETTACRLGSDGGVQGSACPVTSETAIYYNGLWLIPGRIVPPSAEDTEKDKERAQIKDIIKRAKKAGLTDAEISLLLQHNTP
jgi:hypothetical protein